MRAVLLAACLASLATGCSLLFKPDRDAIVPDRDGGRDGGPDAGDGGPPDGGETCVPVREICDDPAEADEDCDGQSNCFDFDCRGEAQCCRPGTVDPLCPSHGDFVREPADDFVFASSGCGVDSFGAIGRTRALIAGCQPITSGMRFGLKLEIEEECAAGATCDYAALSFGPLRTLIDGSPYASELRVELAADGSLTVDRAGTELARRATPVLQGQRVEIDVDLEPGMLESGHEVLFATVRVVVDGVGDPAPLLSRTAVAPLDGLQCIDPAGGPPTPGLYVAIEGAGDRVDVIGELSRIERRCSNPSLFRRDTTGIATDDVEAVAAGGVGAPTLVNYCRADCSGEAGLQQWDLWVDGSADPRSLDHILYVDFEIFGYASTQPSPPTTAWMARTKSTTEGANVLLGPSAREPTLLAVTDDGAASIRVHRLLYAYARRTAPRTETYAIHGGYVDPLPLDRSNLVEQPQPLLTPEQTGGECVSLRDPLLLAHYARTTNGYAVDGVWLLFTCKRALGARDSIGMARFELDSSEAPFALVADSIRTDLIVASPGTYSEGGVFAPEGFTQPDGDDLTVRLWYLARDRDGARLAHAQGRSRDLGTWPALQPYPANPVLGPDSPLLGSCEDCSLTGATVTPIVSARGGEWLFLIARSRPLPTGSVAHELVPLLQYAPND